MSCFSDFAVLSDEKFNGTQSYPDIVQLVVVAVVALGPLLKFTD